MLERCFRQPISNFTLVLAFHQMKHSSVKELGMIRVMAIVTIIVAGIIGSQQPANGSPAFGKPAMVTRVAAAINGSIVLFRANGRGRMVLNTGGHDSDPVMSPDGRMVAFLRLVVGTGRSNGDAHTYQVMVATPNVDGGFRISAFSQHPAFLKLGPHTIVWEPGRHAPGLAWFSGNTVQYRRATGNQHTVLRVGPPSPYYDDGGITFARDDSAIAAPIAPAASTLQPPHTLRIAVRRFAGNGQHIVTVRFRPGVLRGHGPRLGSVPLGTNLTYTSLRFPLRLHTLEFSTLLVGAGHQITGLFIVPDTGGVAHMILGNGDSVHGISSFGPALNSATHFLYSPDGRYVATDPNNNVWISGEVDRPRTVHVPHALNCVLAQWVWLSDSRRLAYVTACTISGSSPIHYRLTLATLSRFGGKPTVLDMRDTSDQNAIDLAPASRCTACA